MANINIDLNKLIKYFFDNEQILNYSIRTDTFLSFLKLALDNQGIEYKDSEFVKCKGTLSFDIKEGDILVTKTCIFQCGKIYNDKVAVICSVDLNPINEKYEIKFMLDNNVFINNNDIVAKADKEQERIFFNCIVKYCKVEKDFLNNNYQSINPDNDIFNNPDNIHDNVCIVTIGEKTMQDIIDNRSLCNNVYDDNDNIQIVSYKDLPTYNSECDDMIDNFVIGFTDNLKSLLSAYSRIKSKDKN